MPTSRTFPRQALAATLALLLAPASAFCFTVGDLEYDFQYGSDTELRVSGLANSSATRITIPSTVVWEYEDGTDEDGNPVFNHRTCRVTSIGMSAFLGCLDLTGVVIPNSVTNIENGAFRNCCYLTKVTIPNSVTSIGHEAFYACSGLTRVTIGNSVTNIGEEAFAWCSGLDAFSVASDNPAYQSVSGLLLTKDGKTLLYGVNSDVAIPEGVTIIGPHAFSACSGLTSVPISDSVTSIGEEAFYGCNGLTNVTIGNGVTNIGGKAFAGCGSMEAFSVADGNPAYKSVDGVLLTNDGKTLLSGVNGDVAIPDGVTELTPCAFLDCAGLTSVTIPDSVTSIGDWAFFGCSGLTRITIPDAVTNIGDAVFSDCSGLTNVIIPDSVTSIGDDAFAWCNGLTRMAIPDSVTSIGERAFNYCSGLTSVTIPDNVTNIGYEAFSGCSGLTSVTIGNSVAIIGAWAFRDCSGLTNLTLGNSVTIIGTLAFDDCSGLTSISIPNSVTIIYGSAFSGCRGLTAVEIHDLAAWCGIDFENGEANPLCHAHHLYLDGEEVVDLTIPDTVTSIGPNAFYGCSSLTNVFIPDSVTSIGAGSFSWCSGLTSMTIPDSVTSIGSGAFEDCASVLYDTSSIPGVCLVDGWAVGSQFPVGDVDLTGIRGIGGSAFRDCIYLTRVSIPNSITSIGDWAFAGCSDLTSVTIPDSVASIGFGTFYDCSGLKTLSVPGAWKGTGMLDGVWGWEGKPEGCVVVYRNSEAFPPAQDPTEVAAALVGAADWRLGERIGSVEEYDVFRAWITTNGLDTGTVRASTHAWISYALGAGKLFENEPEIVLGGVSVASPGTKGEGNGVVCEVTVTVLDGENAVAVDAAKVADLFEATSDPCDWEGSARIPAKATVSGSEGLSMKFQIRPDGGTAQKAFLRLAH